MSPPMLNRPCWTPPGLPDPTGLRQVVTHFEYSVDPDRAEPGRQRRYERRGVWLTTTIDRMVAVRGLMAPRPARS